VRLLDVLRRSKKKMKIYSSNYDGAEAPPHGAAGGESAQRAAAGLSAAAAVPGGAAAVRGAAAGAGHAGRRRGRAAPQQVHARRLRGAPRASSLVPPAHSASTHCHAHFFCCVDSAATPRMRLPRCAAAAPARRLRGRSAECAASSALWIELSLLSRTVLCSCAAAEVPLPQKRRAPAPSAPGVWTLTLHAAQVLCADAEPLLAGIAASGPLLQLLMAAPEAWAPGRGPDGGHSCAPAVAAGGGAASAPALAVRWSRVVASLLARCGRELIAWLEARSLSAARFCARSLRSAQAPARWPGLPAQSGGRAGARAALLPRWCTVYQ